MTLTEKYNTNWRQLIIFKIEYTLLINQRIKYEKTAYIISFNIEEATKECKRQYTNSERKNIDILNITKLGYPTGIHYLIN